MDKKLINRALMGDKQAQEECAEKGIALPCPFCGGEAALIEEAWLYSICCKDGTCIGSDIHPEYGKLIYALTDWNTRPAPPIGRCGECEHYNTKLHYCDILSQESDYRELHYVLMSPDDFCSYFEPKEEE